MSNVSIQTIPKELQHHILSLLSIKERLRLSETCHGLKDVVRDPILWKKLVLSYERIKNKTKACREHVERCSRLQELCITEPEETIRSDKIMSVVMKAKATLTSLSVADFALNNISFKKISQITQLSKLEISVTEIKCGGITSLVNLSELKSLKIDGFFERYNTVDSFTLNLKDLADFFSRFKKLEQVVIGECALNDEVVESLVVNSPYLRHLDINCYFATHDTMGSSLNIIGDKCPQLTHIGLTNLYVYQLQNDDVDITQLISKCTKLKSANFEGTQIKDSALARLACCSELESLNLSFSDTITKQGIESFLYKTAKGKFKCLEIKCCGFLYDGDYEQNSQKLKKDYPNTIITC